MKGEKLKIPRLSIITINYNNALGLLRTLESVVLQTSNDFEYIIIDGGSTDGSLDVIKEFAYIIDYWVSESDNGIYQAMNKGVRVSKGEYCQFLNSGDWLVNSKSTSLMLANLPDSGIIYGNMLKQMSNKKILINKEIPVHSLLTFYAGTLNHSSAYIKRSLFEKYGFYDENLKIVSDWKFYLIVIGLNNEKVSYRNIDLTCFDMKGISNNNKELDRIERRKVLEQLIPTNILADYDHYANYILQMKRINRFKFSRWMVWFFERFLFKIEKWETQLKGEQILY